MSFRLDGFNRIRARLDLEKKSVQLVETTIGQTARFPRGARLRFEFGLFYKNVIADASLISASRLRVYATSDPDAALAMDKTIGPLNIRGGLTQAEWDTGEPDKAHLTFEFTAVETAEGVFGGSLADADTQHWFLLTSGVGEDFLMAGTVVSFDGGYNPAGGTVPVVGAGATQEQITQIVNALLQDVIRKTNPAGITVEFTSPTTGKKVKFGAQDSGDALIETQTDT